MPAKVIPFHSTLRRLHAAGTILSLDDVRAQLDAPPPDPVEWVGTFRDDDRETRTFAQLWKSARDICAAHLGVSCDRVDCVRADERRLSGNGAA